ncbi:MAG: hypothetical protein ABR999_01745 [Methanoregula sp.]
MPGLRADGEGLIALTSKQPRNGKQVWSAIPWQYCPVCGMVLND